MKIDVFWDVALCSPVEVYRCFTAVPASNIRAMSVCITPTDVGNNKSET